MADPSATSLTPNSAATSNEPSRVSTPANAPVEKAPDDGSKLKTFLGVLRRYALLPARPQARPETTPKGGTCADRVGPGLSACLISLPCASPSLRNFSSLGQTWVRRTYCEQEELYRTQPDEEQSTCTTWTDQTPSSALATLTTSLAVC